MEDKILIRVCEVEHDKDGVKPKKSWKNMNWLEKIVLGFFDKRIEDNKVIKELRSSVNDLTEKNKELTKKNKELTANVSAISSRQNQMDDVLNKLLVGFNTDKANAKKKYTKAIDELSNINELFKHNIREFSRARELNILHKLINYLYEPSDTLRNEINSLESSRNTERIKDIFDKIDKFNTSFKQGMLDYLNNEGRKWEDCVIFPYSCYFSSDTMSPYNATDINEGNPIYVVSLGFNFPNSNYGKVLPEVIDMNC